MLVFGTPEGWSSQIYEKLEWWAYQIMKEFRWQVQPFWHNTRVTDVRTTEFQLHITYALYSIDLLTRVKTSNIRQTSKKAFRHAGRLFKTSRLRQTKSSCYYNKRRAVVAAQTERSRCKFRYAPFRDYRHTRASRLLESELTRVLKPSLVQPDMNQRTHSPYYVRRYDDQYHGSRHKAFCGWF